jgi:hypothetical protein
VKIKAVSLALETKPKNKIKRKTMKEKYNKVSSVEQKPKSVKIEFTDEGGKETNIVLDGATIGKQTTQQENKINNPPTATYWPKIHSHEEYEDLWELNDMLKSQNRFAWWGLNGEIVEYPWIPEYYNQKPQKVEKDPDIETKHSTPMWDMVGDD